MIDTLEIDNFVDNKYDNLINHLLDDTDFCWYHGYSTLKRFSFFSHTLLRRVDGVPALPENERIRSDFFKNFKELFLDGCDKNKINVKDIFRMNLNLTMHRPEPYCDFHVDHNFPHINSIIYLNDFNEGNTFIYNEVYSQILKKIGNTTELPYEKYKDFFSIKEKFKPKKNKAVFFNGNYFHNNSFCKPGELRLVLVTTFI